MALLFTIIIMVGVLVVGHYIFEHDSEDDRNDTWRKRW